ncbi:hypothetical protein AK812_SmicGene39633 [Symbiodinium microadriaticum]|uniref:Uncharacterized protein n=1 Tax=Symbiodinium microadriaticum TaxID=2951 RepID=A0A1Q9CAQ1_SYMMI|nr:hypothetical protein AK812_SmicGene39633 [Symbiodinium microadriaticum]
MKISVCPKCEQTLRALQLAMAIQGSEWLDSGIGDLTSRSCPSEAIGQLFQRVAFLEQSLLSLPVQMREFDEAGEKLASRITQLDSLHPEAIHDKLRAVEARASRKGMEMFPAFFTSARVTEGFYADWLRLADIAEDAHEEQRVQSEKAKANKETKAQKADSEFARRRDSADSEMGRAEHLMTLAKPVAFPCYLKLGVVKQVQEESFAAGISASWAGAATGSADRSRVAFPCYLKLVVVKQVQEESFAGDVAGLLSLLRRRYLRVWQQKLVLEWLLVLCKVANRLHVANDYKRIGFLVELAELKARSVQAATAKGPEIAEGTTVAAVEQGVTPKRPWNRTIAVMPSPGGAACEAMDKEVGFPATADLTGLL